MVLRVVLDTNLLVSYLLSAGTTISRLFLEWEEGNIIPVTSPQIVAEMAEVLERPRLRPFMKGDPDLLLDLVRQDAVLTPGILVVSGACRDPKDDKFLAAAVEGQAEFIVTGDEDLLDLQEFQGIRIVRPAQFVAILDSE